MAVEYIGSIGDFVASDALAPWLAVAREAGSELDNAIDRRVAQAASAAAVAAAPELERAGNASVDRAVQLVAGIAGIVGVVVLIRSEMRKGKR